MSRLCRAVSCVTIFCWASCWASPVAAEPASTQEPTDGKLPAADSLGSATTPPPDEAPQGYDKSITTGDIPKPSSPELDPDLNHEEEFNPDHEPDQDPRNSPSKDAVPENFLVGATFALTVPHLLNLGLESVLYHNFGISLNYGNITESIRNVDLNVKHADILFRWFPLKSSFFAGIALGQHTVKGELSRVATLSSTKQLVPISGKIVASANYIIPQIGWFAMWDGGFTLGADIGYLLPSTPTSKFTASIANAPAGTEAEIKSSQEYADMKDDLETSAKSFIAKPVPMVTLLRFGWMF
jgi:hypothetical protein